MRIRTSRRCVLVTKKGNLLAGMALGALATAGAVAGSVMAHHKKVIQPLNDEDDRIATNRRKANRKAHSAHQSPMR